MLDGLADAVTNFFSALLNALPKSPFVVLDNLSSNDYYTWLCYLNWFIPINTFVAILEVWLVCIALYYVIQIALRWIKAIE